MDTWHYEPVPDLDQSIAQRLERFPREPDMLVYACRGAAALAIRLWFRLYHRFSVDGIENVPTGESCVIVANHASHLDAPAIVSSLPLRSLHRTFPAAAKDYFFVSTPRSLFSAVVVNALPFDRRIHAGQSIELFRRLLVNRGNIVVLFPEGTRSVDGKVGRFKPGVGLLLAGLDVPAIPCHIHGAFHALPKDGWIPLPRRIQVRFGRPMRFTDAPRDRDGAERVSGELQHAVEILAGHDP
jgi:1-acyl-sn-glycerol-3-phosphate acyltransferase